MKLKKMRSRDEPCDCGCGKIITEKVDDEDNEGNIYIRVLDENDEFVMDTIETLADELIDAIEKGGFRRETGK